MTNRIRHALRGQIRWLVKKDGQTIRESCTYSNLILDQGLDFVASYAFADCFRYCVVGSGTTAPTKTDTGLANELRRTNNYSTAPESNGATLTNNVFKIFRTFIFSAHEAQVTYGEVGFSPIATAGNNLFSKALLKNGEGVPVQVTVGIDETLTVRYELSIEIFDAAKIVRNAISGQTGYVKIQKVGLKGISALGVTENYDDTNAANEPSVASTIFLSNSGDPPEPFNQCLDRNPTASKMGSLSNYVTGSYGRNKVALFKPSEKLTEWRSVGVGSGTSHGSILVFNSQQTADASKAYLVTFQYFWVHQNESNFSDWLDGDDYLYLNKRLNKVNTYAYFAL
jgi:hypothetical protein